MVFNPYAHDSTKPAEHAFSITAGASALTNPTRGIYVGGSGDITVTMVGGESVTFANLAAGVVHPIRATHVTSATATDIVGLY